MAPYMDSHSDSHSDNEFDEYHSASGNSFQEVPSRTGYAKTYPSLSGDGLHEPIAIVGMACRLPGDISSADDLWKFLREERSAQGKVPSSRFNLESFYNPRTSLSDSIPMSGGYFIDEDLRLFENSFFGIHNLEAASMDPQQRKLLEVCFEALESSGTSLHNVAGANVGCYVANFTTDFQNMNMKNPGHLGRFVSTGQGATILSNRISYAFDLKGPSLTLDTACSSSLYCLHLAVQALRRNECDGAIVAGANLIQSPEQHMGTARLGVLSKTSTCHTFAADADGYGRADGVGALYVKRLSDAILDGDPIRSIIRGTAINSNGKGNGITMPSILGQRDVIQRAYVDGQIESSSTDYVECHGTGTQVGDPIEVAAIADYFRNHTEDQQSNYHPPLLVGSVKSNLGHSEAASGITSIIKSTMALEYDWIPATIGIGELNPAIPWDENSVQVVRSGIPWPKRFDVDMPRRISINSFGYGGSNAHCVLEKFACSETSQSPCVDQDSDHVLLFPVSAATEFSLQKRIEDLHLAVATGNYSLQDVAYTLTNRRSRFAYGGYVIARQQSWGQAAFFDDFATTIAKMIRPSNDPFAFIFTGQGAQWPAMAADLYDRFPVVRQRIDNLDHVLAQLPEPPKRSLKSLLIDGSVSTSIHSPEFAQPACTAVQIALVDLIHHWGIKPAYVIGHSSGEMAAAYAAGHISAGDAIKIAYARGVAVSAIKMSGAMLAIGMGEVEARSMIQEFGLLERVQIACVNSPENVTLSGDESSIDEISDHLSLIGCFARKVKSGRRAYHSYQMRSVGGAFQASLEHALPPILMKPSTKTTTVMISTVRVGVVDRKTVANSAYWRENLESAVLFRQAIDLLAARGTCQMIELGPHPVLELPVKQTLAKHANVEERPAYLSTLSRNKDSARCLFNLAGRLWIRGYPIRLDLLNQIGDPSRVKPPKVVPNLPRYKWCYDEPLWSESRLSREYRFRRHGHDELLGTQVPGMSGITHTWRNELNIGNVPWLKDHRLHSEVVYPAAAYIDMVLKAVQQVAPPVPRECGIEIRDFRIMRAIPLQEGQSLEIFTELKQQDTPALPCFTGSWTFVTSTFADGQATPRASGTIHTSSPSLKKWTIASDQRQTDEIQGTRNWYKRFSGVGMNFGPSFQMLEAIHCPRMRDRRAIHVEIKAATVAIDPYQGRYAHHVHPTIIDSQFQAALIATTHGDMETLQAQVPVSIDRIRFLPGFQHERIADYHGYAQAQPIAAGVMDCAAQLTDAAGSVVFAFDGLHTIAYPGSFTSAAVERHPMLRVEWLPDLRLLRPGYSDGLTRALAEASNSNETRNCGTDGAVAELLVLAAKARCDSSILVVVPALDADAVWAELGGGSKFALFDTLVCATSLRTGILDGCSEGNGQSHMVPQGRRPLAPSEFDIILLDGSVSDDPIRTFEDCVKPDGIALVSGGTEPGIRNGTGLTITTAGSRRSLYVIRRTHPTSPDDKGLDASLHGRNSSTLIITDGRGSDFDDHLTNRLTERIGSQVVRHTIDDLEKIDIPSKSTVIVTAEVHEPFLTTASASELRAVQKIAEQAIQIIWVVGGSLIDCQSPDSAAVLGLSRSIMLEQPAVRFQVLGLEHPGGNVHDATECVTEVLSLAAAPRGDMEFIQRNGMLYISRFVPDQRLNAQFNSRKGAVTQSIRICDAERLELDIEHQGQFDSLHFLQKGEIGAIKEGHVRIDIMAIGITDENVDILSGRLAGPGRGSASQYAGMVTEVGSNVTQIQPGDRVVAFAPGSFSTSRIVPASACVLMNAAESYTEMASVPAAYMTALHGLADRAHLQSSESVLIHSATSSVGLAALQVARSIGATVFVTLDADDEDGSRILRSLGIRPERMFDSYSCAFTDAIMEMTNGRGVDVVLNSSTIQQLQASVQASAMSARLVQISGRDVPVICYLDTKQSRKCLTFSSFSLSDYYHAGSRETRTLLNRLLQQSVDIFRRCPVQKPQVYNLGSVQDAFQACINPRRIGNICVSLESRDSLVKAKPAKHSYRFSSSKSYLLVGCLGGLGRSLTRYMIQNGARNFVFIGRTGTEKPAAKALVEDLRLNGAYVHVVCGDVQDAQVVQRAVDALPSVLGGVVQAAMGLGEALFDGMTHTSWHSSLGPKVQGTWNIHRAIEGRDSELDFFLLTSSLAGSMGTATESNYCTANSFLDYFARYRRRLGKPAVSIGFGTISEVGYLHEHPEIEEMLERRGLTATTEADLTDICDVTLCHDAENRTTLNRSDFAHILTGLEMTSRHAGWEQGYSGAAQVEAADARISILMHAERSKTSRDNNGSGPVDTLSSLVSTAVQANDLSGLVEVVLVTLVKKMSHLVLIPEENILADTKLTTVGMDSMLAAEYRTFIFHSLRVDMPFLKLMDPNICMEDLAKLIATALMNGR